MRKGLGILNVASVLERELERDSHFPGNVIKKHACNIVCPPKKKRHVTCMDSGLDY